MRAQRRLRLEVIAGSVLLDAVDGECTDRPPVVTCAGCRLANILYGAGRGLAAGRWAPRPLSWQGADLDPVDINGDSLADLGARGAGHTLTGLGNDLTGASDVSQMATVGLVFAIRGHTTRHIDVDVLAHKAVFLALRDSSGGLQLPHGAKTVGLYGASATAGFVGHHSAARGDGGLSTWLGSVGLYLDDDGVIQWAQSWGAE